MAAEGRFRDFDAADEHENQTEPIGFKLGGEVFEVHEELPIWPLIRLAKATEESELEAMASFADFVLSIVPEEDGDRLLGAIEKSRISVRKFMELVEFLMEEDTGRPTEPPSSSPPKRASNGRSSRAAASARA